MTRAPSKKKRKQRRKKKLEPKRLPGLLRLESKKPYPIRFMAGMGVDTKPHAFVFRAELGAKGNLYWAEQLSVAEAEDIFFFLATSFEYEIDGMKGATTKTAYAYFSGGNELKLILLRGKSPRHSTRLSVTLSRSAARKLLEWLAHHLDWDLTVEKL